MNIVDINDTEEKDVGKVEVTKQALDEDNSHLSEALDNMAFAVVEVTPDDADRLGAFEEDALSEEDALDSLGELLGVDDNEK